MRVLSVLPLIFAVACFPQFDTKAVRNCDAGEFIDCCTDNDQCLAHFGDSFGFCIAPGETTGQCVECTVNEHCDLDEQCVQDTEVGRYCAPLVPRDDG